MAHPLVVLRSFKSKFIESDSGFFIRSNDEVVREVKRELAMLSFLF